MDDAAAESYAVAGYGRSSTPGQRFGLVVVDMCVAYFDNDSPLNLGQPAIIDAVREVVVSARKAGVPVIWTRVEFPAGGGGSVWYEKAPVLASFDVGNRLAGWMPGVEPAVDDVVVTKQHASGFFGTDLAQHLHAKMVDTVLICGVSTSGCVRATAIDASAHGFIPFVVREAVGDRTDTVNEANLFDLHAKYADVITLAEAVELLTRN